MNKLLKMSVAVMMFILFAMSPVYAQNTLNDLTFGSNIQTKDSLRTLIVNILNWLFGIFLVIAVAMLIYAGFLYATAGGSQDQVKKAKNTLTYALIGVAIAVLSKAIVLVVQNILTSSA